MIWHLLGIRVKVVKVGSPLHIIDYQSEYPPSLRPHLTFRLCPRTSQLGRGRLFPQEESREEPMELPMEFAMELSMEFSMEFAMELPMEF